MAIKSKPKSDEDDEQRQSTGSFVGQMFLGLILSSYFYSIVWHGARAVQSLFPLPGNPVVALIAAGVAFYIASRPFVRITGGYVYAEHLIMMTVFAAIGNHIMGNGFMSTKGASPFVRYLGFWAMLAGIVAIFIGNLGGALTMWGLTGDFAVPFMITFPGPWPGVGGVWAARAFGWEILAMVILTIAVFYLLLRDLAREVPAVGAVIVAALSSVGWSISGASFSVMPWLASNTASCFTPLGCFPDTFLLPFPITAANTGSFPGWVAYGFGGLIGVIIGGIFAFAIGYWAVLRGSEVIDFKSMFGSSSAHIAKASMRRRSGFRALDDDESENHRGRGAARRRVAGVGDVL